MKRGALVGLVLVAALAAAGVTALLVNIFERKQEARNPYFRVVELTDWKRQVREHRSQLVVGAAVVGFAIGGLMALRRRRG